MNSTEKLDTDVLVVGAGASGIPAAIMAARSGARVVLLEEDALPGGAPVDNYVTFLCGGPRRGIYREMVTRLNARYHLGGAPVPEFGDGCGSEYWYTPSAYVAVLLEMLANEPNLRLICGAVACEVLLADAPLRRRVTGMIARTAAGRELCITAKVTIDATGTGLVAERAGAEIRYGRDARADFAEPYAPEAADSKAMPCTWMYISQRVRPGPPPNLERLVSKGFVESGLGWSNERTAEMQRRNTGMYLHWGATVECSDTRDPICLAAAQREAFTKLAPDLAVLREIGLELHLAPKLGVRECRRVMGEYVLTMHDLTEGQVHGDAVAWCDYFLDLWGEALIRQHVKVHATIPYRSLIPRGLDGLLVAGKCISSTHIALSAYRVQPIVAGIGQAAGAAAALAVARDTDLRAIPVPALQTSLRAAGALP